MRHLWEVYHIRNEISMFAILGKCRQHEDTVQNSGNSWHTNIKPSDQQNSEGRTCPSRSFCLGAAGSLAPAASDGSHRSLQGPRGRSKLPAFSGVAAIAGLSSVSGDTAGREGPLEESQFINPVVCLLPLHLESWSGILGLQLRASLREDYGKREFLWKHYISP